jgi:hypothetical protein
MAPLSTPWVLPEYLQTPLFVFGIVFSVIWTVSIFYAWVKSREWPMLIGVLFGIVMTAIWTLFLVGVPSSWLEWLRVALTSPWFYIVFGVISMAVIGFVWMKRDSPNVEIETPFGMEELQVPVMLLVMAVYGFVTLFGILGLFDYGFVRYAETTISVFGNILDVFELIGSIVLFCISVVLIFQRYLLSGIIFGLLSGASVVALYIDIF